MRKPPQTLTGLLAVFGWRHGDPVITLIVLIINYCCNLPYEELSETEDSEILEVISVKPYRRLIRRTKYKRHCDCENNPDPKIITPPPSERLLPKSNTAH